MQQNYTFLKLTFISIVFSLFTSQINAQKKDSTHNAKPNSLENEINKVYKTSQKQLLFKEQLNLKSEDNLVFAKSEEDKLGFTHEKYQHYYKGVKVDFATPILHIKNGEIKSMSGEFYQIEDLNTTPILSENIAFQKATSHIGAATYLWQDSKNAKLINYIKPVGELVILPGYIIDQKENKLAYKFDIYATKPISRGFVYVDALDGKILFYNAIIKHANNLLGIDFKTFNAQVAKTKKVESPLTAANAATRYSGSRIIETASSGGSYVLSDNTRGSGIKTYDMNEGTNYNNAVNFTDSNNDWTSAEWNNTAKDNGALDAHWGAEMTYDYWLIKHDRNSFDGAGAAINSYVHYDSAYDNAFWDGSRMTYGDGSSNGTIGNGYFDILTSLDVAAHEIGHAICSYTADLAYQKESGAMNEAFSDIWAASVEYYAAPEKDTWLIGEDIERRTTSASLRSMSNPKAEGQPDTYGGTNWIQPNCGTPTQSNDYCGVHTNSGVLNHWFYILSIGKSGTNDIGSSYSVTGVGIDKAAKIAFRLESVYLSANSTYANARTSGIQSAIDLYGAGSAEVIATTNAFYAVGVGTEYGNTSTSYCTSKGNSVADEYIGHIQIGTINNASSGGSGYGDYTSISTDLNIGNSATITITPTWTGTVYSEGYSVWIDYNNDGDFSDLGEQVWSKAASKTTPVSGTFTVPSSALIGSTRMRVSMKYNAIPTSCEALSYGEVEDYTIVLVNSAPDTQAPTAPLLTASTITNTTVDLSWTGSTDNVGVTDYDVLKNGILLASVTGTSYPVTGLAAGTTYNFTVKAKDATGNVSVASNVVNITTLNNQISYCTSKGSNATYEWIDYVSFGGMTNTTGTNNGYSDFTSKVANVVKGSTNQILFSAGFKSSSYTEFWAVWIDFNQDGTFADSEKMVSGSSTSSGNLSANITIPSSAITGLTRMRVSMKYNAAQTACETFSYGEVEDYTLNISNTAVNFNTSIAYVPYDNLDYETETDLMVYPNPTAQSIQISFAKSENFSYKIWNRLGQVLKTGNGSKENIDVSDLKPDVYILEVNDGQKSIISKLIKE
ncbi:MAG: peptidase M4 [Flavobacteria bacterium RIFCSPLOWO2_12_FULL_35_11]|nr:MAG: peptidase M4 [Flavobacteria bacterium RIFCSPLOWO2_12_FULL_35_11]